MSRMTEIKSRATARFICLSFTEQNTVNPLPSFSASSTATYCLIKPLFSSRFMRSNTGVVERFTRAASSLVVSRAFSCSARSICRSTASSTISLIRIIFYKQLFPQVDFSLSINFKSKYSNIFQIFLNACSFFPYSLSLQSEGYRFPNPWPPSAVPRKGKYP